MHHSRPAAAHARPFKDRPMESRDLVLSPGAVARAVLIAVGLLALTALLWAGRDLLFIVFFGVLVSLLLSVAVDPLVERGMPRLPALLLVLLVAAGLMAGAFLALWPTMRSQLNIIAQDLPQTAESVGDWFEEQYQTVVGSIPADDSDVEQRLREGLGGQISGIIGGATPVINTAVGAIGGGLVMLVTGIYFAASPGMYRRGMVRLLPPEHRQRVDDSLARAGHTLRRWMVGSLINMTIVGLITGIALWLLDVPAALTLGVIAGLLEFVPIFGPLIASIPAIAIALTVTPLTALWVALLFIGVQQLEGNVLTPVVMRGAVDLPPALTLLFQTLMAIAFGFLGLFLAVPILAAVMILVQDLYVVPMEEKQSVSRTSDRG